MDLFDLSGQVALVTGSSRGIGCAIVRRFAEHGARVVVTARNGAECEAVAAGINRDRGRSVAVAASCDIADGVQRERLVEETCQRMGRLDVLVCNAAINPHRGPSAEIPEEMFRTILETNIVANSQLVHLALPKMVASGGGTIILLATTGAFRGSRLYGAYCMSKAALVQMARNIAVEYGRKNIRANCIAPGPIRTDMARDLLENPRAFERLKETSPLQRIGEPDEVAGAAIFLAAKAGGYMTGQTLVIDGGLSA